MDKCFREGFSDWTWLVVRSFSRTLGGYHLVWQSLTFQDLTIKSGFRVDKMTHWVKALNAKLGNTDSIPGTQKVNEENWFSWVNLVYIDIYTLPLWHFSIHTNTCAWVHTHKHTCTYTCTHACKHEGTYSQYNAVKTKIFRHHQVQLGNSVILGILMKPWGT